MDNTTPSVMVSQPQALLAQNIPLCSGCGVDHLYKDCSMRRPTTPVVDPKTTSLNLLGVERGRIAHIPLINTITQLQTRAMRHELKKHEKEKLK